MAEYSVPIRILTSKSPLPTHISLECLSTVHHSTDSLSTQITEEKSDKELNTPEEIILPEVSANAVIQLFIRMKSEKRAIPPKLENLRSSVMRSFKKTIRAILQGNSRRYSIKKLPLRSSVFCLKYSEFAQFVTDNRTLSESLSLPRNGPQVDSHTGGSSFKTYNNAYLKSIFSSLETREMFHHYVEVLFSDTQPDSLSTRFQLRCCEEGYHSKQCDYKWALLKQVVSRYLGVNPDL